jgi:hypothetical protein
LGSGWYPAGQERNANKSAETFEINREVGRKQYFGVAFIVFAQSALACDTSYRVASRLDHSLRPG